MSRRKHIQNKTTAKWKPKQTQSKGSITNKKSDKKQNLNQKAKQPKKQQHTKQLKINNEQQENKLEDWMINNLEQQKTEFDSIMDIYSNEINIIKKPTSYQFKIINDDNKSQQIILDIKCPIEYPCKSAPIYSISSTYLKQIPNRNEIENKFKIIYNENDRQCIMFEWISEFQEFASNIFISLNENNNNYNDHNPIIYNKNVCCSIPIKEQRYKLSLCPNIIYCEKFIEDRKSLFKSYASYVKDINEIKAFIDTLKSNKKIAKATHNMIGYRLSSLSSSIINEHYDDDGEYGGGKVILEILRKRKIINVVVMVSRWYGGIHLSSDRFKHIKTMTQYVLEQGNIKGNNGLDKQKDKVKKPMGKNIEIGKQICNRLYWNQDKDMKIDRNSIYIGCTCKDKSLNDIIEFNLDEYGVQKSGIQWIEYVSYKGLLIWDIYYLVRRFDEIKHITQRM